MNEYRFYGDLADWWPLISPPDEYEEESAYLSGLLCAPGVDHLLELGSGGGHVAFHLKELFELTLVDLSEDMLAVSRRLNPTIEHIQGDMRTVRLGRQFDGVFIYDAIDYMTTASDLTAAIETAFIHCRPGGLALLVPDHIVENYHDDADHGGFDGADGRSVRYLEWSTRPSHNLVRTDYAFLLRQADGSVGVVHETHHTGLFARDEWLRLLSEVGFEPEVVTEVTSEDRVPRELFLAHRPEASSPR